MTGFASNSSSWFYIPKIKGECEEALKKLNFNHLFIYRPGLLRCSRTESRPLEYFARIISNYFDFFDFWSISTEDVAKVMVSIDENSQDFRGKVTIFEHRTIVKRK